MGSSILTKRKSQLWSIDFIIAVIIFLGAIIVFYNYVISEIDANDRSLDHLANDAKLVSDYLLSAGHPENWTTDNVNLIGLTDGYSKLDIDKVNAFYNISSSNYHISRALLSTSYNYNIYFEDSKNNRLIIANITYIGKNHTNENIKDMIKIERFVFYNSSIIKMVVLAW